MTLSKRRVIEWSFIGKIDYSRGLSIQDNLYGKVSRNSSRSNGFLLLAEYEPVITVGRFGRTSNITAPREEIRRRGVRIHQTRRGGDVTFHGPGQLVGYPIIDLRAFGLRVKDYVRVLEQSLIDVVRELGIDGKRRDGYPGVWVRGEKIAAIGVGVKRGVTTHGFALNINTDLRYFSLIVPCGISNGGVTSIKKLLGREVTLQEVATGFTREFGSKLKTDIRENENMAELPD